MLWGLLDFEVKKSVFAASMIMIILLVLVLVSRVAGFVLLGCFLVLGVVTGYDLFLKKFLVRLKKSKVWVEVKKNEKKEM